MCSGADSSLSSDLLQELELKRPENFFFLKQSGCTQINKVDDGSDFYETLHAMTLLGFETEEIHDVVRILTGVLHLGDLEFCEKGDGSQLSDLDVAEKVGRVVGVSVESLQSALCTRTLQIRSETQIVLLRTDQAFDCRNAAAKALYGRLFEWLIRRMNEKLFVAHDAQSIGVLDIFGFESFDVNSFEQFCINFANEKLQQHFTHHIFRMEQAEYATEGIDVTRIEFIDNEESIALIEGSPGIIRMLDEEIYIPKGSDSSLVEKLHKAFFKSDKEQ